MRTAVNTGSGRGGLVTPLPVTGSVRVGSYVLEVGTQAGSVALFEQAQEKEQARVLGEALAVEPAEEPTQVEVLEKVTESAGAVTDRIEHAQRLFEAASQGRLLDRDLLTGEIGSLLELLQRLDKEGRYEEELRLARALHGVLVLTSRWLELVRSLRMALGAARAVQDVAGQAWALHELGALHLCAGRAKQAKEYLERALALEERLGDAIGRCPTRHNLDSARRDLARRGASRRLRRSAALLGAFVLLAGAGGAFALVDGSSPPPPDRTPILAVDLLGGGTGRVTRGNTINCPGDCDETVEVGTSVRLTASALGRSTFAGWEDVDCEEGVQDGATCTVKVDEDMIVGAVFEAPGSSRLTVELRGDGSGRVTRGNAIDCPDLCDETVEVGTSMRLRARAVGRSTFAGWEGVDCQEGQEGATCTVKVDEDMTVGAVFEAPVVRRLTVDLRGEGRGSVTRGNTINCPDVCVETVEVGTTVTLTAKAAPGSRFVRWEDVDCGQGFRARATCNVRVDEDLTVGAVFEPLVTVSLTVRIGGGEDAGTVTSNGGAVDCGATCTATFVQGARVELTADPADNATFDRWEGVDCEEQTQARLTCTVTMSEDLTVVAVFLPVD